MAVLLHTPHFTREDHAGGGDHVHGCATKHAIIGWRSRWFLVNTRMAYSPRFGRVGGYSWCVPRHQVRGVASESGAVYVSHGWSVGEPIDRAKARDRRRAERDSDRTQGRGPGLAPMTIKALRGGSGGGKGGDLPPRTVTREHRIQAAGPPERSDSGPAGPGPPGGWGSVFYLITTVRFTGGVRRSELFSGSHGFDRGQFTPMYAR